MSGSLDSAARMASASRWSGCSWVTSTAAAPSSAAGASENEPGSMTRAVPFFSSLTHECPSLVNRIASLQRIGNRGETALRYMRRSMVSRSRLAVGNQPSSRRRSSSMPKWWAISWMTVRRTWSATSGSVRQMAQIARR
jgi:hypothetical protein